MLVDPKYSVNWPGLLAQVRTVTDKPITHVIYTHSHPDHAGSIICLPESVEVIVQANTAANIEKLKSVLNPSNAQFRPMRTYTDRLTLFSGEDEIDLYHFGPAHTNGDTFVVFRAAGVMHAGDVFPGKQAPIIDSSDGGNGATYAETLDKAISGIHGVQRVITGHSQVFSWGDFIEFRDFYKVLLEHARANLSRSGRDKIRAFHELILPAKFKSYKLDQAVATMDEIYWTIQPRFRWLLAHITGLWE